MNERDCPHGHQLGKCDTCDLIVAYAAMASKDAALKQAVEALGGWRVKVEDLLKDDPDANVRWPVEDETALAACREALEPL